MIGGMLGLAISTIAFAYADTYLLLVIARVAQGVAGGASWTIGLGLLADVFPTNRLGVVMGTVMTAHTVGFALGPAIGGFLFEYGGFTAPFFFCAGFAAINFLAIVWLAEPVHQKTDDDDAVSQRTCTSSHEGDESTPLLKDRKIKPITMIDLLKNPRIISCILCTIISASVFGGIEPALPLFLKSQYGASTSTIGVVFVAMVIPAFLAPLIGHLSDKMGRQTICATGMILMAAASPLVAIKFTSIYFIIPPLMLFGLSSPVTLTPILPEMGETVNEMGGAAYAQVYALYNMAYSIGMFIGPVVAGYVMSISGFGTLMTVFAVSLLACSPIMMDWVGFFHTCKSIFKRR